MVAMPLYPTAMIKCLQQSPTQFLVNGKAKIFNSADIADLDKKLYEKACEAGSMMKKARDWLGDYLGWTGPDVARIIGDFDCRLVLFVHGYDNKNQKSVELHDLRGNRYTTSSGFGQSQCLLQPRR